jgi:hypothetical protein
MRAFLGRLAKEKKWETLGGPVLCGGHLKKDPKLLD